MTFYNFGNHIHLSSHQYEAENMDRESGNQRKKRKEVSKKTTSCTACGRSGWGWTVGNCEDERIVDRGSEKVEDNIMALQ
jgi:hypothetical protein